MTDQKDINEFGFRVDRLFRCCTVVPALLLFVFFCFIIYKQVA